MRIGLGFDLHTLELGRKLVIGGVEIPSPHGAKAHSDGDVLLHALCDALLGSIAAGDIGSHFPDSDPQNANRDSRDFVEYANALVLEKNVKIINIDATIILESPAIVPHREKIAYFISRTLNLEIDQISIKAKTSEGIGPIGTAHAVAAMVAILVG